MAQAIVPCVGMDWRQLGPCDALKRIYEELERQVIVIETQREAARMMNPGADLTDFSRRIEALGAEAAQRAWERCEEQRRVGDRGFTIERSEECIARHQSLIWAHFVLIIALNNLNRQAPDLSEAVRRLSERWPDCTTPCVLEYP